MSHATEIPPAKPILIRWEIEMPIDQGGLGEWLSHGKCVCLHASE